MANLKINFRKQIKPMKPMHGMGQPPLDGINSSMKRESPLPVSTTSAVPTAKTGLSIFRISSGISKRTSTIPRPTISSSPTGSLPN